MKAPLPEVFVSYATPDQQYAFAVCAAIEAGGPRCWIAPRNLRPSQEWAAQIVDAIAAADLMVLVLSKDANRSVQVRREVERAVHHHVDVLAVRLGKFKLSRSLEFFISAWHWLDDSTLDREQLAARLSNDVRELLAERTRQIETTQFVPPPRGAAEIGKAPLSNAQASRAPDGAGYKTGAGIRQAALLRRVESALAGYVGPIAQLLVKKAAARARREEDLIAKLAGEIDSESERAAFVSECRRML